VGSVGSVGGKRIYASPSFLPHLPHLPHFLLAPCPIQDFTAVYSGDGLS
jgi:hypothetical protein